MVLTCQSVGAGMAFAALLSLATGLQGCDRPPCDPSRGDCGNAKCQGRAWVETGRCSAGIPDLKPGEACAFGESPEVGDQLVGERLARRDIDEKLARLGGGQVVVGYDASTSTWRLAKGAELVGEMSGSLSVSSLHTPPVGGQSAGRIENIKELGVAQDASQLAACFEVRLAGAEMHERCWDGAHYYRLERARVELAPTSCVAGTSASGAEHAK